MLPTSLWLPILVGLPMLFAAYLFVLPHKSSRAVASSFVLSLLPLGLTVWLMVCFDVGHCGLQFTGEWQWSVLLPLRLHWGIDGLALPLVLLTCLLPPCLVWLLPFGGPTSSSAEGLAWLHVLQGCLLGALCSTDLLSFYVFWEAMLIPVVVLWSMGSQSDATPAALLQFLAYTLGCSLLFLTAILWIGWHLHSQGLAIDYHWPTLQHSLSQQPLGLAGHLAFGAFLLAFLVKVPLLPLHAWLINTYCHAPMGVVIMMSSVMVKVGMLGIWRYGLGLFAPIAMAYLPYLAIMASMSLLYAALMAWVAASTPRHLAAYSSMSHSGLMVLGWCAMTTNAAVGSGLQLLAHGLNAAALLVLVGCLERRQQISFVGGLTVKPGFATALVWVMLTLIGVPGLAQFPGELLVVLGSFASNIDVKSESMAMGAIVACFTLILAAAYGLKALHRFLYSGYNLGKLNFEDLHPWEWTAMLPLFAGIGLIGVWPQSVVNYLVPTMQHGVQHFRHLNQVALEAGEHRRQQDI